MWSTPITQQFGVDALSGVDVLLDTINLAGNRKSTIH